MERSLPSGELRRVEWPAITRLGDGLWWAQPRHLEDQRPSVGKVLTQLREAASARATRP